MQNTELTVNIAQIMLPKVSTVVLRKDATVRNGIEVFRHHGYTAVPVVDDEGTYVGTINEGDFFRHVCRIGTVEIHEQEKYRISEIIRPDFCQPLHIDSSIDELVSAALRQNFVPIVDSRGCLSGIVTRQALIACLAGKLKA